MLPENQQPTDVSSSLSPKLDGGARTTGRWIVTFADAGDQSAHAATLRSAGMSNVVSSLDFQDQAMELAEPLKEQAKNIAQEAGQNLQSSAQDAVDSVKYTAQDAAATVKDEATSAKDNVTEEARGSAEQVRNQQS